MVTSYSIYYAATDGGFQPRCYCAANVFTVDGEERWHG
jgi:hypothetical protein